MTITISVTLSPMASDTDTILRQRADIVEERIRASIFGVDDPTSPSAWPHVITRRATGPVIRPEPAPSECRSCEGKRWISKQGIGRVPCPECCVLTEERAAYYRSQGGNICPYCFSPEIEANQSVQTDSCIGWQNIQCRECHRSWDDNYTLTSISLPGGPA